MILGIEIEPSFVKVAEIKKNELIQWEVFELPQGAIGSEGIDDFDGLVETLLKISLRLRIKDPKAALAISGPTRTAVRIIRVPFVNKDEIVLNLPFELDRHIPFSVKEVYYDFHILEYSKHTSSTELLVAVANKDIVNDYVNVFEKAGITPVLVDIASLALYNIYEFNYTEDLTVAVVNIGENIINFVIIKNNKPLYIRDAINSFRINSDMAEEEGIREFADEASTEIYRQIEFFKSLMKEENVRKIYITGFPTVFPLFISSIQERLDPEVLIFNPFKKIKINKKLSSTMQKYAHISSIAVGLSLRGIEKIK